MVAAMKGMIMMARMRAAVKMPVPKGGPANRKPMPGSSPSVSMMAGCTVVAMIGTMTKKPHMP